jgi:hypothetical protein
MGIPSSELCLLFCQSAYKVTNTSDHLDFFFQVEPLVETLALNELADDRIKDTYDAYGLYQLAKAAYLCVRTNPEQRPCMGEVGLVNSTYAISSNKFIITVCISLLVNRLSVLLR